MCPRRHSFILQIPRNYFECSDIANTPQLQSSWRWQCEFTVHRKMSALSTAGAMVTTHDNSVMMWSFKGPKLFSVLENLMEMKKKDGLHIVVLSISLISFRIWDVFLIGQFILVVTFSIRLGPLRWVPTAHCAGRRGLNLLTAVRPVELAQCVPVRIGEHGATD